MIYFNENQVKEAYQKSNPIIQRVVSGTWVSEDIALIGKKMSVRVDKIDTIIRLVAYVVLNLLPMSSLVDSIIEETGIDREKSKEIAKKINDIVFVKIRKLIKDGTRENLAKNELENHITSNNSVNNGKEKEKNSFEKMLDDSRGNEKSIKKVDPYREAL